MIDGIKNDAMQYRNSDGTTNWEALESGELAMVLRAKDAAGTRYELSTQNGKWFADAIKADGKKFSREVTREAAQAAAAKFRSSFTIEFDGGQL